jgi:outer membrane protein OmpA-like peptidoglycan-associated protein
VKHSFQVLFLLLLPFSILHAQTTPVLPKLAPDQAGCVDSKYFPKMLECRIDNCEKKDPDHREVTAGEDVKGEAVTTALDGTSRSVMYECREGTTPASIVERGAVALKLKGFEIPYKFTDAESALTARKDNLWITVDAASRYYTLTETDATPPDFDSATDAETMAEMLEHYGHLPVAVEFMPGKSDLAPSSVTLLGEVLAMLKDHPSWRIRVEGHTDGVGAKSVNMALSVRCATSVVSWLNTNGIRRTRLDPQGMGDSRPIADNATEAGRKKNRRIELVKLPAVQGQ